MGTAFTGLQIGSTYNGLLKTTDNAVVNGVPRTITDGLGNDTALKVSTAGIASAGTLEVTGVATLTAQPILSSLTASSAVATDGSKGLVSVTNTGTGNNVLATSPTLVTPLLGTPTSGTLTNCTGLPVATGISGLGTGIATALAVNTGSAGAPVLFNGALGTPSSGTVTNLTGTASININGTVGATAPAAGSFTTLAASTAFNLGSASGGTVNTVYRLNNASAAVFEYRTASTRSWVHGLREVGDSNYHFYSDVAGGDVVVFSSSGLAVTGTVSSTDPAGGAGPAWKLGVAASVSPTSPNRTIRIDIAGTSYYLHAKTTND